MENKKFKDLELVVFEVEDSKIIKLTIEEYDYLILILSNLITLEKKVPKKMKSKNSEILKSLYEKLQIEN